MTRKGRAGFAALAALIAVVVFVLARPDQGSEQADDPATDVAETDARDRAAEPKGREPTATTRSALPPPPVEIRLRGGGVAGGAREIAAKAGETVRFTVYSDVPDEIHLHGYDLTKSSRPGRPARFRLEADLEGIFAVESHAAEEAGKEALVARLVVAPS